MQQQQQRTAPRALRENKVEEDIVDSNNNNNNNDNDPGSELKFINLMNNYSADSKTKKEVRKHVMTKFRRDQRKGLYSPSTSSSSSSTTKSNQKKGGKKATKTAAKVKATTAKKTITTPLSVSVSPKLAKAVIVSPPPSPLDDDLEEDSSQQQQLSIRKHDDVGNRQLVPLSTILGAGQIDPLNSLPLENSPQNFYLIHHCKFFDNSNACRSHDDHFHSQQIYPMEGYSDTQHLICKFLSNGTCRSSFGTCDDDLCSKS